MMSIANYKTITYEGTNLLTLTLTPTFTKRRYPNKKYTYLVSRNIPRNRNFRSYNVKSNPSC